MTVERDSPDALAAAIADGDLIDWDGLAARADTPAARARLARFELLARIAAVHAAADNGCAVDSPGLLLDCQPGGQWGTLRIVERLAAGTFGTVYRAHDTALARDVALKILRVPPSSDGAALEAVREGRLLARVRHANVVAVYGADQRDGRVGVWMELVEGTTLEEELAARGPLPPAEVAGIGVVLASALHAVHEAGLVHRDVKAQNVMRDGRDGRLVLMDFSAGREQAEHEVTDTAWPATLVGSPLYLAPELFTGAPASARTDVYSLGVLLFRLLSARYPVEGASFLEIERAHRSAGDTAWRRLPSATPPALRRVLARALARPGQRYATADAFAADLAAVTSARRQPPARWRLTLAGAGLLILAPLGYLERTLPARPTSLAGDAAPAGPSRIVPSSASPHARALVENAEALMISSAGRHPDDVREPLQEADDLLAQATAADGDLAYAWMLRGRVLELQQRSRERVLEMVTTALRKMTHAAPAERGAIEGFAHRVRADSAAHRRDELLAAAKAYEATLAAVPGDYWALVELEQLYQRLQRSADAERIAVLGAVHHPRSVTLAAAATRVHLRRRDHRAVRAVASRALHGVREERYRYPAAGAAAYADLLLWEAKDAWLEGDVSRALRAIRDIGASHAATRSDAVRHVLAGAFESLARFTDARDAASLIADEGSRAFRLALIDARQEQWTALRGWLHRGGVRPAEPNRRYSFMYIWAGHFDEARHLLSLFRSGRVPASWQVVQEFEAQLRTAEGRSAEALALFAPLLVDETAPRLRMHEFVARARLGVGDVAGALTVLERIEAEPVLAVSHGLSGYDWLRCLMLLAEVYRDAGRAADAAQVAARVRTYLAVADQDHPFVIRLSALP